MIFANSLGRMTSAAALALAWSIACCGPGQADSAAPLSSAAPVQQEQPPEPFGLATSPLPDSELKRKWLDVESKLGDEDVQLALCDADRNGCASDAAVQFLAIVDHARTREGRARIGEINRAVNLAIHPMSDLAQFGRPDVWSSPLVTFYRGAGDCEDYAIAKYVALKQAGFPDDSLRIVVVRDALSGEGHAIAVVRLEGHWLILDNRRLVMIEDISAKYYHPLFVLGRGLTLKYENGSSDGDASGLQSARH
jgi:predicted transglutaminase-like cysteine proteinase